MSDLEFTMNNEVKPERTYTEDEIKLERTATLQEAIEIIELSPTFHKHRGCQSLCHCEICAYVRGNVTELRARLTTSADRSALSKHDAELKAQTAAMLKKLTERWKWAAGIASSLPETQAQQAGWLQCADELLAAISADYAAISHKP